jgi:hypothetical protein
MGHTGGLFERRSVVRKLGIAGVLVLFLAAAGSASATTVWYADVQTSNLLGNRHADLTTLADPGSVDELLSNTELEAIGAGLGSGFVSVGSPLDITHTFSPNGYTVDDVSYASVTVGVFDDLDLGYEFAELVIDSDVLDSGNAFANLFGGEVTALITAVGDAVSLTIQSTRGDFLVAFSALAVEFEGTAIEGTAIGTGPTPAIPEPSAALIFATGLFIAGWRRRV